MATWQDLGAGAAWQAVHDYPADADVGLVLVLGAGLDVWSLSDYAPGDLSGATVPNWAAPDEPGGPGTISDGDLVWFIYPDWVAATTIGDLGTGVQPTTPNGHAYGTTNPDDALTGGTEPVSWPTTGGTVDDGGTDGGGDPPGPDPGGASYGALAFDVYAITPPGDAIEFLATLDDASDKSYRPEHNGTGSGQFVISRQSPNATVDILAMGNLVKVRLPAVSVNPIGSFFLETGDFDLISRDEEGGEDLHFGGRGDLAYWDRAIWLSEVFTLPWWPDECGDPEVGAKGMVVVAPGRYRFYNVDEGATPPVIDGPDRDGGAWVHGTVTAETCRSFDKRATYQWPDARSKRFLVRLMDGPHAGAYFHPHQDGVTEYLKSKIKPGFASQVTLGDVGVTPGDVLHYLFSEGTSVDRPVQPIPLMTIDFTAADDSDGNPWNTSDALPGLSAGIGETFLETIGQLLGTGVIDIVAGPHLDMHAYNSYGRDLQGAFGPGVVRFEKDVNIAEALTHEVSDGPVATFAEVRGNDDTFARVELPDAATRVAREMSVTGNSDDETALEQIGLDALRLRLARGDSVAFPIVVGDDETAGAYTPGPPGTLGHFWLGDTVTLTTGAAAEDFVDVAVRVTAITLSEDEAGELLVVPELRTGPLPVTGSVSVNSPDAVAVGDCGCPCDLGEPYPLVEET